MKYTADLKRVVEDKLDNEKIIEVTVNLIEVFPQLGHTDNLPRYQLTETEDKTFIAVVNVTAHKFSDRKGTHTIEPEPRQLYNSLIRILSQIQENLNSTNSEDEI